MANEHEGPPYKDAASVPKGRPTPTQDELNKIALGEAVELAKDGTPEDKVNVPLRGGVIGVKSAAPTAHHEAPAAAHARGRV